MCMFTHIHTYIVNTHHANKNGNSKINSDNNKHIDGRARLAGAGLVLLLGRAHSALQPREQLSLTTSLMYIYIYI